MVGHQIHETTVINKVQVQNSDSFVAILQIEQSSSVHHTSHSMKLKLNVDNSLNVSDVSSKSIT
jgi:hypothetical protein